MTTPKASPLTIESLSVTFRGTDGGTTSALHDVTLEVRDGEVLGVVGESGSGKSTLLRAAIGLVRATAGRIRLGGIDVAGLSARRWRPIRRHAQMVFQDPHASLDPRRTVAETIGEPLGVYEAGRSRRETADRVAELLAEVGLAGDMAWRHPHELSGGQRQRVGIARALSIRPRLLLLDEPVSALDLSVRAQVLNLLLDLRERHGLTYVFVSHDLAVVRVMADRVAVFYRGRLVECGERDDVLDRPLHPYTRQLRAAGDGAMPVAAPPGEPGRGCVFAAECPRVENRCRDESPVLRDAAPGHAVACHLDDLSDGALESGSRRRTP